jgi:hypothetical protein
MATAATATNQQLSEIIAKVGILPTNMLEQLMKRADTLDEWLGRASTDHMEHIKEHANINITNITLFIK